MKLNIFCYGHSRVLLSILHVFYAACMFYGTAFMYNQAILCIFSPILEVEINIIIIIINEVAFLVQWTNEMFNGIIFWCMMRF